MDKTVAIIGGGPAGLMAAEVLSGHGLQVDVYDSMSSLGRKFLMAGKKRIEPHALGAIREICFALWK